MDRVSIFIFLRRKTVTSSDTHGFRWGIERRLEFIEFRLFWEGGVNRSDIVDEFGISVPQASKDLTLYQEQAPNNIRYDRSEKRYLAAERFQPNFIKLDGDAYLARLVAAGAVREGGGADWVSKPVSVDALPIPQRHIKASVLRTLLHCVREAQSIEILYQSMNPTRPEPIWRRISPHAFGNDGLRWHTRAFCHIDKKFKDFVLSRCLGARSPDAAGASPSDDSFWAKYFSVLLCPNPRLSVSQQKVIAEDFAMEKGEIVVPVRRALLYYFNKRLRLDVADQFDDPSETPVIIKNRDAFDIALSEAMR